MTNDMSDLMFHGILNAPLPDDPKELDVVAWSHFRDAARTASARILSDAETIAALEAEIAALRAQVKPKVKPLVWEEPCKANNGIYVARSIFGDYGIHIDGGRHRAWLETYVEPYENWLGDDDVGTVWEAQAAAQADYERRILEALECSIDIEQLKAADALAEVTEACLRMMDDVIRGSGRGDMHIKPDGSLSVIDGWKRLASYRAASTNGGRGVQHVAP